MGKKKKNRKRDNVGNYTRLDGHVHIYMRDNPLAGGDGGMELHTAIANAKANGVTHMITVMHDSLGGFVDYAKQHGLNPNAVFHEIDGVKVSFGAEVTCRDFENLNIKGNPSKMHLLVVGPRLTPDSPIVKLLELKTQNDIMVDFGQLLFVAEANGIKLDPALVKEYVLDKSKRVPGFSSIGRKNILDFFAAKGIDLALSQRDLSNLLDKVPPMPRMNIDMRDLIKVAHASGAMVIFAHPAVNLRRTPDPESTVRNFYIAGGDGAESDYSDASEHFDAMMCNIGNELKKGNRVIRMPGSDTHRVTKTAGVGKIKGKLIVKNGQEKVLEEINNIEQARQEGKLTSRVYTPVPQGEIDGILAKYQAESDMYMATYEAALERHLATPEPEPVVQEGPDPDIEEPDLSDVIQEVLEDILPSNTDDNTSGPDGM